MVISARTQAFGNALQRRTRNDAVINTAMRARSAEGTLRRGKCRAYKPSRTEHGASVDLILKKRKKKTSDFQLNKANAWRF